MVVWKKYVWLLFIVLFSCKDKDGESQQGSGVSITNEATEKKLKEDSLISQIKKFPDSSLNKENLIQFYRENNELKKALAETQKEIDQDSSNARWWKIKATLHYENGDTVASIKAFEKAIALYPAINDIISLGLIYGQTANKKALEVADYVLSSQYINYEKDAWYIKGLYYTYSNNKPEAIRMFDKTIGLSHTFMDAYREKAIALYDLQKYKEAADVLIKATTIQNSFDEGYFYLGKCYEKINKKESAIESYQKALLYAPDFTEAEEALKRLSGK